LSRDNDLQRLLELRKADYVSSFRVNEISGTVFLEIPVDRIKERAEPGYTSRNQISRLRSFLEQKLGFRVIVVSRLSRELNDIETGLRALLLRKFPDSVYDVSTSFHVGTNVFVWVVLKNLLEQGALDEIIYHTSAYLKSAEFIVEGIEFVSPAQPEPSIAAILRTVKRKAPAQLSDIFSDLGSRGLRCPSEKWLATKLDSARKKGWMIRNANGSYVLTAQGISLVPISKSRSSSDIERMLLLARRREW